MSVTLGPFVTCFLTAVVLIAYLSFITYFQKDILYEGMKFAFVVIVLIIFRMMIPLNFPFTVTIPVTGILAFLNKLLYYNIGGTKFEVAYIFIAIWIIGGVRALLLMHKENQEYRRLLLPFRIKDFSEYPEIKKLLEEYHASSVTVCIVSNSMSPAIYGVFKPILIIPDIGLNAEELEFACRHELEHYKNHDLWLKLFLDLAVCVQWFNPLVKLLQDELVLAFEMSNDNKVLKNCSKQQRMNYLLELVKVAKLQKENPTKTKGLSFTQDQDRGTKRRIYFIGDYGKAKKKSVSIFFRYIFVVVVLVISFVFVPEGYNPENIQDDGAMKVNEGNSYLIKCKDGYQLYVDDKYLFTCSPIPEEFVNLPTIEEEEME